METLDYFLDFYSATERQGPGDDKYTIKALEMLDTLPSKPKILDIGCGSGKQTRALARSLDCHIFAVDLYPCFLEELKSHLRKEHLEERVTPMEASMTKLPFDKEEFDLIWSEGAIYIMGFRNGISSWKKLIKPGGYLVVSEISWFRKDIPSVLIKFWEDAYPEMDHIENKRKVIEKEGYILKGNFQLDRHAWLENYYKPLEQKVQAYLDKHKEKNEAFQVVDEFRSEVELYNKYNQYFGYVFYIMQKPL